MMGLLPEFKIFKNIKNDLNINYTNYCNFIIKDICQLGYDTDTVCSITGSILGARFGSSWINTDIIIDNVRIENYVNSIINLKNCENINQFLYHEGNLTLYNELYKHKLLDIYVKKDSKRTDYHSLK